MTRVCPMCLDPYDAGDGSEAGHSPCCHALSRSQTAEGATINLPDSGARTKFATGAVRDASVGKGWPSEIPPIAIRLMAKRFEDGGIKYLRGNWRGGIPLSRYQDAIMRHTLAAAEGKTDEDHLGAVLWNAACWAWTEEAITAGRLPAELDDLPFREKKV